MPEPRVQLNPLDLDRLGPIMGGDVIVWKADPLPEREMREQVALALAEIATHSDFLLLIVETTQDIGTIDEAEMLQAGWVKAGFDSLFGPDDGG